MGKAVFPTMQRRGYGRIVNVSSGGGQRNQFGGLGPGAYGISKAALNALTIELANAVRGDIKVNAVDPGWVATRMGGLGAPRKPEEAAQNNRVARPLPSDGSTGGFYIDPSPTSVKAECTVSGGYAKTPYLDERFAGLHLALVILTQATRTGEPAKGALHHPSAWLNALCHAHQGHVPLLRGPSRPPLCTSRTTPAPDRPRLPRFF